MTKHRAQVNLDSLNEILVIKVEHTGDEVVEVDAEHPDLLIVQETAWLVVKTILPKGSTEIILHFDDARVVQVQDLCIFAFILVVEVGLTEFQEAWSKLLEI